MTNLDDNRHTPEFLKELQALPMERKMMLTQARIMEYYQKLQGNVYVSFSGGKDSMVLLDIAREIYPDIPAVFSNTGLEYPEIQRFVKAHENVEVVYPKMRFDEVISKYGYPLIGKEVAEAIYYARRICSQPVQVEREREPDGNPHLIQTGGHRNRRTVLTGAYPLHAQPLTTVENSTERERSGEAHNGEAAGTRGAEKLRRNGRTSRGETDWANWRRGCL